MIVIRAREVLGHSGLISTHLLCQFLSRAIVVGFGRGRRGIATGRAVSRLIYYICRINVSYRVEV